MPTKINFDYTPRTNNLNASSGRGLFTIQNKRSLLLAWPTSPTGLPAKAEGILTFPVLFSSWTIDVAFFLLVASSIALFCCLPFRTWEVKALAQRSIALAAWCLRMLGRHPLVALSLPSAYLLLVYPPLWKDVDALCQLILPADVINIYHFPALFCFSAHSFFGLVIVFLPGDHPSFGVAKAHPSGDLHLDHCSAFRAGSFPWYFV